MTKVPLVIFDAQGVRHPIGEADVEMVDGELVVSGEITHPAYQHLVRDNYNQDPGGASVDYSVGFVGGIPVEAVEIPEMAVPKPIRKNIFDPEQNHD